jgi:hypothetical protein
VTARGALIYAAWLVSFYEEEDVHPWEQELANERLALAARDYVREVDASPNKPVGW